VGNRVTPLIHGAVYFERLHDILTGLEQGDHVWFADWRGDAEELLREGGPSIGALLAELVRRGVDVRGLLWRSHSHAEKFSKQENEHLGEVVNKSGGEVFLDERVRRSGSHHQKLVIVGRGDRDGGPVGFVGGIDLGRSRRDDERHAGDPQALQINARYGPRPPWHDLQMEVRGPAIGDLIETFRERWVDPAPLDHRTPWAAWLHEKVREPKRRGPLPPDSGPASPAGTCAVQVLRTYPARRPAYPFAPQGERSVARAYAKALTRARSLIYIEDQYVWSKEVAEHLGRALRGAPEVRLIVVVPRYPDREGVLSGPLNLIGQQRALGILSEAGGDRFGVFDLENDAGTPIYVHSKVCVIDDVWVEVGSDNLNRRSWTHDSELACAIIDSSRDDRAPADPGGLGDGARRFARELRLAVWREHLGPGVPDSELLDPAAGFDAWNRSAAALDEWHAAGRVGPRPPGRVRGHRPPTVRPPTTWWARPLNSLLVDPDGRSWRDRMSGSF
jgi:phosphatidylserine/phosphatidylglycerophosphate/cardiolipin synthase-like enzyme